MIQGLVPRFLVERSHSDFVLTGRLLADCCFEAIVGYQGAESLEAAVTSVALVSLLSVQDLAQNES